MGSLQQSHIREYINKYTSSYNLNTNNCSDFALGLFKLMNFNLPDTTGYWPFGNGTNPGDLGEDIRTMPLTNGMSKDTKGGNAPSNTGTC